MALKSKSKIGGAVKKVASFAVGAAKSYVGLPSSEKKKTKKRRFSINKATNKLLEAKIKGKIMKEKIKVVNSIK